MCDIANAAQELVVAITKGGWEQLDPSGNLNRVLPIFAKIRILCERMAEFLAKTADQAGIPHETNSYMDYFKNINFLDLWSKIPSSEE